MGRIMGKDRNNVIDLLKVICMLYIVCFWHLSNYGHVINIHYPYLMETTGAMLGAFMFYGAYFFSKYSMRSLSDVMSFYKKRFIRVYVLYVISLVLLYVGGGLLHKPWFDSDAQFALALFGLSSFHVPNVTTLWFMSMLIFFYMLTPLVLYWDSIKKRIIVASIIELFLLVLYLLEPDTIDVRLPHFSFFYLVGLVIPHSEWEKLSLSVLWGCVGLLLFIVTPFLDLSSLTKGDVIGCSGGIIFLTYLCYRADKPVLGGGEMSFLLYDLSISVSSTYLSDRKSCFG